MHYGGMKTVTDLINAFGGNTELAKVLDAPSPTVAAWKHRGIPPRHFPALVAQARAHKLKGITLESLHTLKVEQPKKRKERAG